MPQNFNMHLIKRQAHKEAWYGDSWNPFRTNMRRSTFPLPSAEDDIEAADVRRNRSIIEDDESPLSHFSVEPGPGPQSRGYGDGDSIRRGSMEEYEMTDAGTGGVVTTDRQGEVDEEYEMTVAGTSEAVVTNDRPREVYDEKAAVEQEWRRRFLGKFRKVGEKRPRAPKAGLSERKRHAVRRYDGGSKDADRIARDVSLQPISVPTENRRKVLRVLINAKEHIACPDSGSEKNIMSEALAIELQLDIRRRPKDIKKFELGSGKFIWSTGRVRVIVQLPGLALRRTKFWFYVFKACPVAIVLGMFFLAGAEILTRNRHLLEDSPSDLSIISSLLWIGSPRSDASMAKQPPNRLRCWLDGRFLVAVADTGSDLNMMSHKCARREGFPINTQPEARSCVLFGDGTEGETVGQVYIYNLTLDWRSAETRITGDQPYEVDNVDNVPGQGQPNHDEQDVTQGSTQGTIFHVLEGLPCDIILGQSLLERMDAFNYCSSLLSSKFRDKTRPFEYHVLISLGPWTKKLSSFRKKPQNNASALENKKIHDDDRHDEMFRRSEKEVEITLMPKMQQAEEEAREKRMIDVWNTLHLNCDHCNPV